MSGGLTQPGGYVCDLCYNENHSDFVIITNTICVCQECIISLNSKASTVYRSKAKNKPKLVNVGD